MTASYSLAQPIHWPHAVGGNGHYYEVRTQPTTILWEDARQAAENAGGYLATITSPSENQFLQSLGLPTGAHIGGIQLPDSTEPAGGWSWITGEKFQYTNWYTVDNEPNDQRTTWGNENRLQIYNSGFWNDISVSNPNVRTYVIEYNVIPGDIYERNITRLADPEPPPKDQEYDSLVIITHGYQASGVLADATWIDDLGDSIRARLINEGKSNWLVYPFHWETFAWPTPKRALLNGEQIGSLLGRRIGGQAWQHVHLIGHSAGSALIQAAAKRIRALSPSAVIHTTFLDPFLSYTTLDRFSYGEYSDWADSYFSQDALTSYTTHGKLTHAFNVDVTGLDPNYTPLLLFSGTAGSTPAVQTRSSTSHGWPYEFYANTVPPNILEGSQGLGFPLSKEGGGWDNRGSYSINNSPIVLGDLNPLPVSPFPMPAGSPVDLAVMPVVTSAQGASVIGADRCELVVGSVSTPQSPRMLHSIAPTSAQNDTDYSNAWIGISVLVTQLADYVAFDVDFASASSEGILTVYWNTNILGSIDERAADSGSVHYRLSFPDIAYPSIYSLGFRLSAFTNEISSVNISNIVTGYSGDTAPFDLHITMLSETHHLKLIAPSNAAYLAYSSSNLTDWSLFGVLDNTNGVVSFYDPSATNDTRRFYRSTRPENQ